MICNLKNRKGESLIETIIALVILATGITFSGAIIGTSLRNVNTSKARIIAVNITREGIEAVRSIRDTNWLKFSYKRRACWNHDPAYSTCNGDTPILPGRYIAYKETNGGWRLESLDRDLAGDPYPILQDPPEAPVEGAIYVSSVSGNTYRYTGANWLDLRTLFYVDIDLLKDSDLDHDYENDKDQFNHVYTVRNDALAEAVVMETQFMREIRIDYLTNDGSVITDPASLADSHNRMRITSQTAWNVSGHEFSSELSTHITDYLGRETLNN